ncbi:MAG: hypothetical protein JXC33_12500 [Deltaproteobacteria bacterium]|nr:hypothetical protein [Deltaproteobacteria bacterium]
MYRKFVFIVIIIASLIVCGCQNIDLKKVNPMSLIKGEEKNDFKAYDLNTVDTIQSQAIVTAFMAQLGMLKSLPFVKVDAGSSIEFERQLDPAAFVPGFVMVQNYADNPDGSKTFNLLVGFVDRFGRRDMHDCYMTFTTTTPDGHEISAIQQWLIKNKNALSESKDRGKDMIVQYQKQKGLTPDGLFGRGCAREIAKDFSIIHIQKLESLIYYPEMPAHLVYLFPFDAVKKNPQKYTSGMEALPNVVKESISSEKFLKLAPSGQKLVLVTYFLDHVDPSAAVRIGFSSAAQRWSNTMSSIYYAEPGTWPVIAETFCVDDALDKSGVYVNIFMKSGFTYKCIASHEIKSKPMSEIK